MLTSALPPPRKNAFVRESCSVPFNGPCHRTPLPSIQRPQVLRRTNRHARQVFVSLAARHLQQVGEELVLGVRPHQVELRAVVHVAAIARVTAVAAAQVFRRRLKDHRRRPASCSLHSSAQRGVPASGYDDVVAFLHCLASAPGRSAGSSSSACMNRSL